MEWLFPVLFALAFIKTQKDLALVCCLVSSASSLAYMICDPLVWSYEQMLTLTIALNLVLAFISKIHWAVSKKPLARCMSWLAVAAISINLVQVFEFYPWTANALLLVQMFALIAILSLDGRKEYLHDVAAGFVSIFSGLGFGHSGHNSSKG